MELLHLQAKQLYKIKKPVITIGRAANCDLTIVDKAVSRFHCTIVLTSLGFVINDGELDNDVFSTNGTYVNGRLLEHKQGILLKHQDEIQLSSCCTLKVFCENSVEIDDDPTLF